MGRGILAAELRRFEKTGKKIGKNPEWKRREGFNLTYEFADAVKSAFGLFFFQHMSMPEYQASPDRGKRRKNAENILKVKEIPCNNQITRLIDGINPGEFDWNFRDGLGLSEKYDVLERYRVLDGGVLIALDGVSFFGKSALRTLSAPDEERENGL